MNTPNVKPWSPLLIYITISPIMTILNTSWYTTKKEVCSLSLEDDSNTDNTYLLDHSLRTTYFEENWKISHRSVTKQLTIEVESLWADVMIQRMVQKNIVYQYTPCKCLTYLQCDSLFSDSSLHYLMYHESALIQWSWRLSTSTMSNTSIQLPPFNNKPTSSGTMVINHQSTDTAISSCSTIFNVAVEYVPTKRSKGWLGVIFCQVGFVTNIYPNIFHRKISEHCLDAYMYIHSTRDTVIPNLFIHDYSSNRNSSGAKKWK